MPKKIKKRARPTSQETEELLDQDSESLEDGDEVDGDEDDDVIDAEFDGDDDDDDEAPHSLADELLEEVPAAERDAFHNASYQAASWTEQHGATVGLAVIVAIVVGLGALGYKQWSASQAVTDSAQVNKAIKAYATIVEGSQQEAMLKQLRKDFKPKKTFPNEKARWEAVYSDADASLKAHSTGGLAVSAQLAKAASAYRLGKYDEAISTYQAAIKDPLSVHLRPFATYGLAMSQAGKGDTDAALKTLDGLKDDKSFDVLASYQKARLLDLAGKNDAAKDAYHKALEAHPQSPFKSAIERRLSKLGASS